MFHLDTLATLVAATLTLLLGRKLVHSVSFLKKYTIPEPVAGGLLVALALLILKKSMGWEVNFDMSLRDPLMLAFFAPLAERQPCQSASWWACGGGFPDCGCWPVGDAKCHWHWYG